ncbi:MAG: transcriptional regulator [Chloroflexi bacterium]|nr:transcriptional regulator [Chloroflexota bacterium]
MNAISFDLKNHWIALRPVLTVNTPAEYNRAVNLLNKLLDEIGDDLKHPLYGLLDVLGTLLYTYEEAHFKLPEKNGAEMLRYFMDEHGLTQSDLPELGSQGVVSEILSGKRELNVRQIRSLAALFHVSPSVFI